MMEAVAFCLILMLAVMADGLMDALGPVGFLLVGAVVMALTWALVRIGDRTDAA